MQFESESGTMDALANEPNKINKNGTLDQKVIDMVKGRNVLIVSPPATGKTMLVSRLIHGVYKVNKDVECKCYLCSDLRGNNDPKKWDIETVSDGGLITKSSVVHVHDDDPFTYHTLLANSRFTNESYIVTGQSYDRFPASVRTNFDVVVFGNIKNASYSTKQRIHHSCFGMMTYAQFVELFNKLKAYEFVAVDVINGTWVIIKKD